MAEAQAQSHDSGGTGQQPARNWAAIFQAVLALFRALSQQAQEQGETQAAQALTDVCQATEQAQAKVQ